MATLLKYIKTDLQKFGRNVTGYPKYPVTNLTTMASVGIKSITYKGVVKGEDGNYIVFVQFFDVKFSKKKVEGWHPIKVERKLWYYKTPTVRFNPVKMRCQCLDFRMRFERELFMDKALIGNWRRYDARKIDKGTDIDIKDRIKDPRTQDYFPLGKSYVRKTPPPGRTVFGKKSGRWIKGREFVNPLEYRGICKHVWSFLWYLRGAKLLVS